MRQGVRRAGGALAVGLSAFADETGVDPGGVVGFGLNTLACVAVVICAALGKADD